MNGVQTADLDTQRDRPVDVFKSVAETSRATASVQPVIVGGRLSHHPSNPQPD
jgi:hypothetical protein